MNSSLMTGQDSGDGRICVAVSGRSVPALLEAASKALNEGARLVELRLDALPAVDLSTETASMAVRHLLALKPGTQIVATCRGTAGGGEFAGTVAAELAILLAAAGAGAAFADLAIENAEKLTQAERNAFTHELHASGARLIISSHDFETTGNLAATRERVLRHRPDVAKIVSTARTLGDNLAVRRLLDDSLANGPGDQDGGIATVAMAMGEAGLPSRVLGPAWGSLFTFASPGAGAETAPGQVPAETLRGLYRAGQTSSVTRVYGVAGKPVAHSLSPAIHSAGFQARGMDAVFIPLATDDAVDLLRFARELPLHGLSITMPLKQSILPLLDSVDPLAARVGAANTIVRHEDGSLHGYNTDVAGVILPLRQRLNLHGARVLVDGAGGAARAAVFGLVEEGADVWVHNRTPERARGLAEEAGAHAASSEHLARGGFDVWINATPAGMRGVPGEPAGGLESIPAQVIFEMVYHPRRTPLIEQGRRQGSAVIEGSEMFLTQALRQWELWTGQAPPREAMEPVLMQALASRESVAAST